MPSVLGKRTRQAANAENVPASPPKRRQTRRSALPIYEDAASQEPEVSRSSVKPNTGTRKRSIQNNEEHTAKPIVESATSPSIEEDPKENVAPIFSTPSAPRFKDVLAQTLPSTPRHRVRLGGKLLTPRSHRTSGKVRPHNVYAAARQLFTQAGNQSRIIGREQEREQLRKFISTGVDSGRGGCLYVSGPPGTGKSALVQEIFDEYRTTADLKISIVNCVSCRTSSEVTSQLSQDLDVTISGPKSKDTLSKCFTSKTSKQLHLVLMDEIDNLLDGDCELLYSMFEWAMHRSSSLLLIGIANALDLTDRFMPRLKSRNLKPQLLPFLPYTAIDMSDIITKKLLSLVPAGEAAGPGFVPVIQPAAIKLIGSKIAAQTGDLRKAFSLVRRTVDQIEKEILQRSTEEGSPTKQPLSELSNIPRSTLPTPTKFSPVKTANSGLTAITAPQATIKHVAKLASSIFSNGTTSRLGALNLQQKAVLCSLVSSEQRQNNRDPFKTPSKSSSRVPAIKDLFEKYGRLCQRDEGLLPILKSTEFRDVVASLETLGLIHEAMGRKSSMLTPSKTPSRTGRSMDERQFVAAVVESEMRESLVGPGSELLLRLLDE